MTVPDTVADGPVPVVAHDVNTMARVDMRTRVRKTGITFCLFMGNPIKKYQPIDEGPKKNDSINVWLCAQEFWKRSASSPAASILKLAQNSGTGQTYIGRIRH
jgi:hypothetical protein